MIRSLISFYARGRRFGRGINSLLRLMLTNAFY